MDEAVVTAPVTSAAPGPDQPAKPPLALYAKLRKVAESMGRIKRAGKNAQQGYAYTQESDVTAEVRKAALAQGVYVESEPVSIDSREFQRGVGQTPITVVRIRMWFRVTDVESGEQITRHYWGEGSDTLDKAIYKAMTGARKYFLLHLFMLSTGDDPEKDIGGGKKDVKKGGADPSASGAVDVGEDAPITKEQRDRLVKLAKLAQHKPEDVSAWLWRMWSVQTALELPRKHFDAVAARLADLKPLNDDQPVA